MKIIPAIDLMGGQVVRLYKGDPAHKTVYSDDPVGVARQWEQDGADMLHIVDLDATLGTKLQQEQHSSNGVDTTIPAHATVDTATVPTPVLATAHNTNTIKKILEAVSIPVEVAGGLRSESSVMEISKIADRMVLGTLAFEDKQLLKRLLDSLGAKRIVISVDHRGGTIVTRGWQKETGIALTDAVVEFVKMGFTDFLLTDVSRDGTLAGPNLESLGRVCGMHSDDTNDNNNNNDNNSASAGTGRINVITSGGISGIDDVKKVGLHGAYGVILGKALYEDMITIHSARGVVAEIATTTTATDRPTATTS